MVTVSAKYPHDLSDNEIQDYIRLYSEAISKAQANLNAVSWATPLIQLGHMELQNRQFNRNALENRKTTRISLALAALSVVISVIALWLALDASRTSDRWEERQLANLSAVSGDLSAIRESTERIAPAILALESTVRSQVEEGKKSAPPKGAPNNRMQRSGSP